MPDHPASDLLASRRAFLKKGTVAAVALPAMVSSLTACAQPAPAAAKSVEHDDDDDHARPKPAPKTVRQLADEMDAHHEAGIKAFPAPTKGKGCQVLEPKLVGAVKVFELTTRKIEWETKPGTKVQAWTYNEQVPGPQIRVREGDRVRVVLHNELEESTSIHFHGLEVPNDQDGVPFITQPPVKPGESHTYEFTVPNAGSHMYHSHHNAAIQVGNGLLGAFIVEPKNRAEEPRADVDYVMILNDGAHGFTLNGKEFPATEPVKARRGQTVRIRFMNEGMLIHPMHLHGMHMTVIAKDGWPQPAPWKCDTLNIAPGERWDVLVKATNPGTWAFHCHILGHAESRQGMFGMVTVMVVQ